MTASSVGGDREEIVDEDGWERMKVLVESRVATVPDFPQAGILYRDITPILADPIALRAAASLHHHAVADLVGRIDKVAGIESRGFLFGTILAQTLGVGFIPLRKSGKLPRTTLGRDYGLEYGTASLEIHAEDVKSGERVLVVDDLLATGGTARAACELLKSLGAEIVGLLFLIELLGLEGRERLEPHRIRTIVQLSA